MPVRRLLFAAVLVSGACLAISFGLVEFWGWAAGMAAATIVWLMGLRRGSPWMPVAAGWGLLAGIVVGAGAGLLFPLVLLAALGFLAAWDLSRLVERLDLMKDGGTASEYAFAHLKLLGAVLAAALVLGLLVGGVEIDLPFGWIVGLTVLVLILVRVSVSLLQRWE
jgi:hypothetical protein